MCQSIVTHSKAFPAQLIKIAVINALAEANLRDFSGECECRTELVLMRYQIINHSFWTHYEEHTFLYFTDSDKILNDRRTYRRARA